MGSSSSKPAPAEPQLRSNSLPINHQDVTYHSRAGNVPGRIAHEQARLGPDPRGPQATTRFFPHNFGNQGEPNAGVLFGEAETRHGLILSENPVATDNFHHSRTNSSPRVRKQWEKPNTDVLRRAKNWHRELDPANSYNTPGPHRAVLRRDPNGENTFLAVMSHPPGDNCGFERAILQPMGRQDRQDVRRYVDAQGTQRRQGTWPDRGHDADVHSTMQGRARTPAQQWMQGYDHYRNVK